MKTTIIKREKRDRRHARIRAKVSGTASVPRLSVFRSNRFVYAQLIDDAKGVTLASASDVAVKSGSKTERAKKVGMELAKAAQAKKIEKVVFDRGGFMYRGRVQALAEGAREGGLVF